MAEGVLVIVIFVKEELLNIELILTNYYVPKHSGDYADSEYVSWGRL